MNVVFLMDPLETVNRSKDTTFAFMCEASRRGYEVDFVPSGGISLVESEVRFRATQVVPHADGPNVFTRVKDRQLTSETVGAVFVRTDPPFDAEYLMHTWLLERLPTTIPVVNSPRGIRTVNEKIWATQFQDIIPRTVVTRHIEDAMALRDDIGDVIAKPTDGYGGAGVFRVRRGDLNTNVIFESLTDHGRREIIVQEYLAGAADGDKRILLLDGEPLGAVLRMHSGDDHRNNFFAGGRPVATEINDRDREIVAVLRPALRELGLHFVGIDIIGDRLVEVNVTSPTCLQEMNRLYDRSLEADVMDFVEKRMPTTE